MFTVILDMFSDDILDNLTISDIDKVMEVFPSIVKMYKSMYISSTYTLPNNMFIECSYCQEIRFGKYRRGGYVCTNCICNMITIPIS